MLIPVEMVMAKKVPKEPNGVTLGIDSSSSNCGIAFYKDGELQKTENFSFDGRYDLNKLYSITVFFKWLFKENDPFFVILEEPINIRNARAGMALNQVAGAICAAAFLQNIDVFYMHNLTAKKAFGVKNKTEAVDVMKEMFPDKLAHATEHECDAVLLVEAYKRLYC